MPPVHGGAGVDVGQDAPDLRFEDLEAADRREEVIADEVPRDVPASPEVARCPEGQEIPGMEVDLVEQLVTAPPVDGVRSAVLCPAALDGVIGGQPQPHPQRGTMPGGVGEEVDVPLQEMMKLWDQSTVEEAKELDKQILSIVGSLGGSTSKYRRERGRAFRAIVSEIYSPPRVSAIAKLCPSFGVLPGFALDSRPGR